MTALPRRNALGRLLWAGPALAWLLRPGRSSAQAYPTRPIHLVVPYAAGGGVDIVARLIGKELTVRLGQSVIVDNKPGAGSNIGAADVARSAPDGYTLLMASPANAINVTLYKDVPYDTVRDLAPAVLVGQVPSVLIASPQLEAKTLAEFIALAKRTPGKLTFGSGGVGASEHLAGALFMEATGTQMVHVPYRGGSAAMNDLISGRISCIIINQLAAVPFVQSGQVRALAMADRQRSQALPDVPTFAESGFPNYLVSVWWGIMARAGTPAPAIDRLNAAVNEALASPDFQKQLQVLGAQPIGGTPKAFGDFLNEEIKHWGEAVKLSGASLD